MDDITIYHNPNCGTSRNVLAFIREAGFEPQVIEYLTSPPTREVLSALMRRAGVTARDWLRAKEPLAEQLGLLDGQASDDDILNALMANPILMNRPIVVTENTVKLCRPSETVKELLSDVEKLV